MITLGALKIIREECRKHESCRKCPIRTEENCCMLRHSDIPANWIFYDDKREEEENVRYFVD